MTSLSTDQRNRYSRHLALPGFSVEKQLQLLNSSILVVGAGGLGCPSLQYLVAAGVGKIYIADDDVVDISNLQRQILFTVDDKGKSKAETAKRRLSLLNPDVEIITINERLAPSNIRHFVSKVDLVLDGSDNFQTRYLVNDACVLENKPWVFCSVYRNEAQLTVFNYEGGPSYRCLFPEPPDNVPSCSEAGVLGTLTGTLGSMMANEAIKVLTHDEHVLSGKLLFINMSLMSFHNVSFERNEESFRLTEIVEKEMSCSSNADFDIDNLQFQKLLNNGIQLLDVRNSSEILGEVSFALNIPVSELESKIDELKGLKELAVFCESGLRSDRAARLLREKMPALKVYNLVGGMKSYRNFLNAVGSY